MTAAKNFMSEWFQEKFGTGRNAGLEVAEYFDSEISQVAAEVGVKWEKVPRLTWQKGKAGKVSISANELMKGFSDSVGIYASIEQIGDIYYPLITFTTKGGHSTPPVFVGINELKELYRKYKDDASSRLDSKKWQDEKAQRKAKREANLKLAEKEAALEAQRKAANVQKELTAHQALPKAIETEYSKAKLISAILPLVDARVGHDQHKGQYLSIELKYLDGKSAGIQRIYDKKFKLKNGNYTNKDFTWGMNKDAAHIVIGDLTTAERIYGVEGFATGGTIYIARNQSNIDTAVIVGMDALNLKKTINAYNKHMPWLIEQTIIGSDNDLWKQKEGKGNTGVRVSLELLEEFDKLKAWVPTFDNVDSTLKPTDWNDLHVFAGLKEVQRQLKSPKNRLKNEGDLFKKALNKLSVSDYQKINDHALKALVAGMSVGFPKYRPKDVINLIRNTAKFSGIPSAKLNVKALVKKAKQIWNAKAYQAQNFRSFSKRITSDSERPEHITYKKFNKSKVDEEVLDYIKGLDGIVIVRFPMGSGKTQMLIKPLMHSSVKSAFFAHRVSLIGGAWDALNANLSNDQTQVTHYKDPALSDFLPYSDKLACCINSSIKNDFSALLDNLDTLCIDEASQTLRHVTAGGAVKYPVKVFDQMLKMMAQTKERVIFADADANDTLVEFCELGLSQRNAYLSLENGNNHAAQKIHVIDAETDCSDFNILYTDGHTAFYKAEQDIKADNKVLIACDSANAGEQLFTHLQSLYPNKKGLFVSLDTKESSEVEAFTDSPNEKSKLYDYLIYSPSISSGVSLENGHFNKHYGIFCGTVAPSDAIQMMRRDRKAREFILGLNTLHSNREDNVNNLLLGLLQANDNQLDINLNKENGCFEVRTSHLQFDRFRLELIAQENQARNDFANNLMAILHADKYQINALDSTEIEQELGKTIKDEARELLKELELQRHLTQSTPDPLEFEQLSNKVNLSKDEKARLNRYDIENLLRLPVNEENLNFFNQGGLSKVKLFELLNLSPETAANFDQHEIVNEVQPSQRAYLVKQRQALRDTFEILGFDWQTGQGSTTPEKMAEAIQHLTKGDKIHLFNNWFKFGGRINPFSTTLNAAKKCKSILEALGLKLVSKQLPRHNSDSTSRTRYSIDSDAWELMSSIHSERTAAHVTAFELKSLDGFSIQSSTNIYIDSERNSDQEKPFNNNNLNGYQQFKHAIKSLYIPSEYEPFIMAKVAGMADFHKNWHPKAILRKIESILSEIQRFDPITS